MGNPRQVMVVPVHPKCNAYCEYVALQMHKVGGLYVASNTDKGGNMEKKIARAIEAKYSFVAVVGPQEQNDLTVTLRPRDDKDAELLLPGSSREDAQEKRRLILPLVECIELLKRANMPHSQDVEHLDKWESIDPE